MVDSPLDPEASGWRSPQALVAVRLATEFVLDVGQISRGDRDLADPLILTAILEANQAVVRHDPSLAQVYGSADTALPDELRRPISINALAKSLQLPFETVRRRVRTWVEAGVCVQRPDGVLVPQAVVTSPPYVAVQRARVARLELFERDLVSAGLLAPAGPDATPLADMPRAAGRALAGYVLRACDRLIALAHGPVAGFVLVGLAASNLQRVPSFPYMTLEEIAAAAQPCSLAELSRRIGAPSETVRRHLAALAGRGLAQRRERGWIAVAPPGAGETFGRLVADNQSDVRRLFAQLRELQRPDAGRSGEQIA